MDCSSCGHSNTAESRFCEECGAPFSIGCSSCGFANEPGEKFCEGCGHDLSQPANPADTSKESAESSAPAGERRQATVVFSDLSGYTAMSEKLDPEEVEAIMTRIKVEAVKIVEDHGGIVNQFVGDEVVALFGIPAAHEDDSLRAVNASLEIHALVHRIGGGLESRIGRPLRMHTGINTGLVVTHFRDDRDGRYGIIGNTVNTGARLAALAQEDQILIGPETRREISKYFKTESLDEVSMKGKSEPMVLYRIVGKTNIQSRFEAAKELGLSTFVGRDDELEKLHAHVAEAFSGRGQFVSVVGDAGVGKSRLFHEFRHSLNLNQVHLLIGRCKPSEAKTPFFPFAEFLRGSVGLRVEDSANDQVKKIVQGLHSIDPALERYVPLFLKLLSIPSDSYPLREEFQGEKMQQAIEESFIDAVAALAKTRPVVIFLEDWQWADEGTRIILRNLANRFAQERVLFLVNHRTEFYPNWGSLQNHTAITLPSLDGSDVGALVCSSLGAREIPEGLADLIYERTDGNPFFVEEVCLALKEDGAISINDSQAVLAHPLDELTLPQSVQAVIRSRVDNLSQQHRHILGIASVIGREFSQPVLERIAGTGADVTESLAQLQAQDLIGQIRKEPEPAFIFKHILTQVVTYETLLRARRQELHGKVGAAIEMLYENRLEEHYESLAQHYLNSRFVNKALHFLKMAGEKAAMYHSLEQARYWYREAIAILDGQEPSDAIKRERIDLSLELAKISHYALQGDHVEILEGSLLLCEELGDQIRHAKATYWKARHLVFTGNQITALEMLEKCLEAAESFDDDEIAALVHCTMGRAYLLTSQFEKSISSLDQGVHRSKQLGNFDEACYSLTFHGIAQCWSGEFDDGFSMIEESLALARESGNLSREGVTIADLGMVQCLRGDWNEASQTIERCLEISRQTGKDVWSVEAVWTKGWATFMLGDQATGIALLRDAKARIGHFSYAALVRATLLECCALAGELDEIDSLAQDIASIARRGESWAESVVYRALSVTARKQDNSDWNQAEEYMRQSVDLAEKIGAAPHIAIGRYRYAELFSEQGDYAQTREQLDIAVPLFDKMAMTWWSDQAHKLAARLA